MYAYVAMAVCGGPLVQMCVRPKGQLREPRPVVHSTPAPGLPRSAQLNDYTALHIAALKGRTRAVMALLVAGAKKEAVAKVRGRFIAGPRRHAAATTPKSCTSHAAPSLSQPPCRYAAMPPCRLSAMPPYPCVRALCSCYKMCRCPWALSSGTSPLCIV